MKNISWKRYLILLVGLLFTSLGIAIMAKASLGVSQISSMPYVLSLKFTAVSLGTFSFLWNVTLILGQFLVLGRCFKLYQLLQIPLSLLFGMFIDMCKAIIEPIHLDAYWICLLVDLLGNTIMAFGITLTILPKIIMNSGEAMVQAICDRWHTDFGITKVVFDISLVLLASITSFILFHTLKGVREGTIIAAVITGLLIKWMRPRLGAPLKKWMGMEE